MMIIKAAILAAMLFAALEAVNYALSEDGPKNCFEIARTFYKRIEELQLKGKFAIIAKQWQMFFSESKNSLFAFQSAMSRNVLAYLRQAESIQVAVAKDTN